jgi:hypothetical protein
VQEISASAEESGDRAIVAAAELDPDWARTVPVCTVPGSVARTEKVADVAPAWTTSAVGVGIMAAALDEIVSGAPLGGAGAARFAVHVVLICGVRVLCAHCRAVTCAATTIDIVSD